MAIEPTLPAVPENLLAECQRDLPLPKGATPPQVAQVIAHDKAALQRCRQAKRALNAAVRAAQEEG